MNIMGKPPLGLKNRDAEPETKIRKPVRKVSAKRAAHRASADGKAGSDYMGHVKSLPCCICGKPGPSDAHHCFHRPPVDDPHGYDRLPGARMKSGDRDTIPLCKAHHQDGPDAIHNGKASWLDRFGPDYAHIPATRAAVAAITGTIDF